MSTEDFSYLKHLQTSKTFKRTVLFFVLVCFGLFWFFVCCLFVCLFVFMFLVSYANIPNFHNICFFFFFFSFQSLFDHIPVGVGSKGVIPMGAK